MKERKKEPDYNLINKQIWERLQKILKESPSEEKRTIKKSKK
jgi:hypothetical protein